MSGSVSSRTFGVLPTGESVSAWTLQGEGGLVLEVVTLGCIVTRLLVPDARGVLADVVLGFRDLSPYISGHPYFGSMVGRVAGRITGAAFSLDGKRYELCANEPPNHLHGGKRGFDKRLWIASASIRQDGAPSIRFALSSPDGDEGYPGTVNIAVIYTVTKDNRFLIECEACSDRPTPLNLTHHSYFNLGGESSGTIFDHVLQINANEFVPTDECMALSGQLELVSDEVNNFTKPKVLGEAIPLLFQEHGDLYRIRSSGMEPQAEGLRFAARLVHPESGRVLNVSTDEMYLQLYTGSCLDGSLRGKSDVSYERHAGVCLECQGYPNGANIAGLGNILLVPGVPRSSKTCYAFSAEPPTRTFPARFEVGRRVQYEVPMPTRRDFRIGMLGSGFIVDCCHLVSYRKAGFNPVAIASRTLAHADEVAARHEISKVYASYDEMLDDPKIEVLDIAVPPAYQLDLIREACARGSVRGILAQKPLALNYAEALEAVELCEQAGIVLSVNQNMRYDPTVHTFKTMLDNGMIGDPVFATIDMRGVPHWQAWQAETGSASLKVMSIHHLDCMRYWFGDPVRVFCSTRSDPRTPFPHSDGICTTILEYGQGLRAVIIDDVWTGPAKEGCPRDIRIEWRVEGMEGLAIGELGWCQEPYTTPSTMRYAKIGDYGFHHFNPKESWFPDAFSGTMGQLLIALETDELPSISGRDNLKTIALVEAAALSSMEQRMVDPLEIVERNRR